MHTYSEEEIRSITNEIWRQLRATTSIYVIGSWGISQKYGTQISVPLSFGKVNMAALVMRVNGFNYAGLVVVAYDEGADYYRIYIGNSIDDLQGHLADIDCESLGSCLDALIETNGLSQAEYLKRVDQEYNLSR